MALEMGIDLTDQVVIREFQKVQNERLIELRAAKEGKKKDILNEKKEYVREDYNDVFRESNRAVVDNNPREEIKTEVIEEVTPQQEFEDISQRVIQPARVTTTPLERKMNEDEEDINSFNPKTIIIGAVV